MVGFTGGVAGGATVAIVITAVDKFSRVLTKAQKQMAAVGAAMVAVGTAGVFAMNKAIQASSNLQESVNAINVVFGESAEEILKMGKTASKSFGLSQRAFAEGAVRFSAFADVIAEDGGNVADVIRTITGRTADFASVMNIDLARAQTLINAGLAGETEGLRRFGIDVSAASVKTFAYANGIATVGKELTEVQKIQARYASILEQTNEFAGDFVNTSDDLANSQRILAADFENAKAQLGAGLLPVMEDMVRVLIVATEGFNGLSENAQATIGIIIGVTAVVFILTGALALATVAAGALGIALLPLTLIIFGIIAAITVIILIMKNWDVVVLALKNTFISFGNIVILVWNKIFSVIEDTVNGVVSKVNFLIKQMNRIKGVSIDLIPELDLSKFKADLLKFDFGVQEVTKTIQKQAEAIKEVSKEQELVNRLEGFKVIPKTGDIFNPLKFQKKDFQSDFAFTQAKRGAGFIINIENIVGLDPEEISRALSDELGEKVSL